MLGLVLGLMVGCGDKSADDTSAVIGDLRIDFSEVARAVVEIEFNPPAEMS